MSTTLDPDAAPLIPARSLNLARFGRRRRDWGRAGAWTGVGVLVLVTLVALTASRLAPYDPILPVTQPLAAPLTGLTRDRAGE